MEEIAFGVGQSALIVLGAIALIIKLGLDITPFTERYVAEKWRKHRAFGWLAVICFGAAVWLHFVWSTPKVIHAVVEPPSKTNAVSEQPKPIVNQQAILMAKQYDSMLRKVSGKSLLPHEERFTTTISAR